MTASFELPTAEELPALPWATWIPVRYPKFKTHGTLGQAKAALSNATTGSSTVKRGTKYLRPMGGGVLYRIVGDRWVPCVVIRPGTFKDEYPLWTAPRVFKDHPGITTVIKEHPYAA